MSPKPNLDVPADFSVSKDAALRVLETLRAETLAAVRTWAGAARKDPVRRGAFLAYVDKHEERLAVLDLLTEHVRTLPGNAPVIQGEKEARHG